MLLNSRNVYNKLIFDVGITAFELNDTLQIEELRKELSVDEYFGIIWSGSKKFIHKINGKEYSVINWDSQKSFSFYSSQYLSRFCETN